MDFTANIHTSDDPVFPCGTLLISFKHWITFFVCAMDYLSILLKDILVLSKFCQLHFTLLATFLCVYVLFSMFCEKPLNRFPKSPRPFLLLSAMNEKSCLHLVMHLMMFLLTTLWRWVLGFIYVHIMPYHSSSCTWYL